MQIVVLDAHSINPGDLSWQGLHDLGECTVYDRTKPEEIIPRCKAADALITSKNIINASVLEALPRLRYIGVMATGYNVIDTKAAKVRNIAVTNVPAFSTQAVAQGVFALLLELTTHVGHHSRSVSEGKWCKSPDWCYWDMPIVGLAGLTFGIIGFGNIGKAVASLAHAFGMKVLVHTRMPGRRDKPEHVEFCGLSELLAQSDVVSLHCPLTPETQGMINADSLALMKKSAFLLNAGRGALVDEAALADALNAGRIAGAGLDVLAVEPALETNPLLHARNCIITPHNLWATVAVRTHLIHIVVENLRAFMDGHPMNVVNHQA